MRVTFHKRSGENSILIIFDHKCEKLWNYLVLVILFIQILIHVFFNLNFWFVFQVAVKTIKKTKIQSQPDEQRRVHREIEIAKLLNHNNIITVHDGKWNIRLTCVMYFMKIFETFFQTFIYIDIFLHLLFDFSSWWTRKNLDRDGVRSTWRIIRTSDKKWSTAKRCSERYVQTNFSSRPSQHVI